VRFWESNFDDLGQVSPEIRALQDRLDLFCKLYWLEARPNPDQTVIAPRNVLRELGPISRDQNLGAEFGLNRCARRLRVDHAGRVLHLTQLRFAFAQP